MEEGEQENPNDKTMHDAKGSAVSSDTPNWFHVKGVPVTTIRLQDQHKYNQENTKVGHTHPGDKKKSIDRFIRSWWYEYDVSRY